MNYRQIIAVAGVVMALAVLLTGPFEPGVNKGIFIFMVAAVLWITEAIHLTATALLVPLLAVLLGVFSVEESLLKFAHPIIFLFLGGFTLGLAMQRWNLHRRIALLTLKSVGGRPRRQIAGFMLATAFLSMWVSNTATAIMMLPIGASVIAMLESVSPADSEGVRRYATSLLLAIAYSASIGGIATLIGTPPNALLAAYLNETLGISIGFAQWMLVGVPVSCVMLVLAWWWLTRKDFGLSDRGDSRELILAELDALGPMGIGERWVAVVFLTTAAAWILRPVLSDSFMPWLNDTGIAVAAAVLMFLIPVNVREGQFLMDWDTAKGLPWGVLLLFGGGLAMAGVISSSGLAGWIAGTLGTAGVLPTLALMALVITVIIFLTEVTSNTATAAAFLPLLGALAQAQGVPPVLLTVPAAIAAS